MLLSWKHDHLPISFDGILTSADETASLNDLQTNPSNVSLYETWGSHSINIMSAVFWGVMLCSLTDKY